MQQSVASELRDNRTEYSEEVSLGIVKLKKARAMAAMEVWGPSYTREQIERLLAKLEDEGPAPIYEQLLQEHPLLIVDLTPPVRPLYRVTGPTSGRLKPSSPPLDIRRRMT